MEQLARAFGKLLIIRALYEDFFRRNKSVNKENVNLGQSAITQCSIIEPDVYAKMFVWNSRPTTSKKKIFSEETSQLTSKSVKLGQLAITQSSIFDPSVYAKIFL